MDISNLDVLLACYFCKKTYSKKEELKLHWNNRECKKLVRCFTSKLVIKSHRRVCVAYLNPQNVDIDVCATVLPAIRWPTMVFHFTTKDNWKSVKKHCFKTGESSSEEGGP